MLRLLFLSHFLHHSWRHDHSEQGSLFTETRLLRIIADPAGIVYVDSTLNRRRKSVQKRKNISVVVEKALKFRQSLKFRRFNWIRRQYFNGFLSNVEKALKIWRRNFDFDSTSNFWLCPLGTSLNDEVRRDTPSLIEGMRSLNFGVCRPTFLSIKIHIQNRGDGTP